MNMPGKMNLRFTRLAATFLLVLFFSLIPSGNPVWVECLGGNYDDYPEYLQAVEDARVATYDEISKNLVAIV